MTNLALAIGPTNATQNKVNAKTQQRGRVCFAARVELP
jgi:hypothetical protein